MKLIIIDKSVIRNIYSNDRKDTAYGTNGAPLIEHQNRIAPHPSGRSQNLGFAAMVVVFGLRGRSAGELNAPRPLDLWNLFFMTTKFLSPTTTYIIIFLWWDSTGLHLLALPFYFNG